MSVLQRGGAPGLDRASVLLQGRLVSAHERLALALLYAVESVLRVPCIGDGRWLSEDGQEREEAALGCDGCPSVIECGQAADETGERFGVWAGADRTRPAGRAKAAS